MKPLFAELSGCAALVLLAVSAASAQDELPAHHWSRGTTLAGTGGVATASDDTGAALGATIGWEINPQVGIEGTGMWIDREPGASAFSASLNVRAALTKTATDGSVCRGRVRYVSREVRPEAGDEHSGIL